MPRLRLRNKLLLFSLVLALIPIGVAGRTLIRITQDELKTFTNEEVVLTAEQIAGDVDRLVDDGWVPALLVLRDALEDDSLGADEKMAVLRTSREIPELVSLQVSGKSLTTPLVILEPEFAERLEKAGLDPTTTLALNDAQLGEILAGKHSYGTRTSYLPQTNDWLLTIVLPLESRLTGASSSLAARVNLHALQQRIEGHRFGKTGSIFLVDSEGHQIFDPQRRDLSALEPIAAARRLAGSGSQAAVAMPYVRPDGEAMLGGFALARAVPWIVMVERSEARAYTAISAMTRSLALWLTIGFVVAVAGAFVFAGRIAGPILEIDRVARDVGQGNFDVRVRELRSGDEIAELARQMNAMIEGLIERDRVKSENVLLVELTEKLRALNDQKNTFLGMAAHDLRNPIGGILGYAEMLLEEDISDEDRTLVSKIEASSKFMLRLLNDLLDISQIESGKLELKLEELDLASLVRENVELNRIIAGKKDIRIALESSESVPTVRADPSKLEQVLSNLVSNAIKFSHQGSTITVSLAHDDDEATIRVRDQGQGIPADELHKLFQEFQQTSVKTTGGEKSTGLGLAIVKKIVEGHGGRIGVESQVGEGSVFHVSLPLATSESEQRGARQDDRVAARVPVYFSVQSEAGSSQAGSGTALDLSRGGSLLESSVPLKVGDEMRFTLRLPGGSITGHGKLVRQIGGSRFGLSFQGFDHGGGEALDRFLADTPPDHTA